MQDDFLRIDEWRRWVEEDRNIKSRILEHIDTQHTLNGEMGAEIAALQENQKSASKSAMTWSSGISTIVSAITSALVTSFKGHA